MTSRELRYSLNNPMTSRLQAALIASPPRRSSICVLVIFVNLMFVGCVDQAAIDDRECQSQGFKGSDKEYAYCREKLQQLRDRDWERRQRFMELMSG